VDSWRDTAGRIASAAALAFACAATPLHAEKVLRYAFSVAETSADPAKVSDIYSNFVISAIFDSPLDYDYLARPLKLIPNTLEAMPEVSADRLTYTMRVKPGIYFSDDPAFNGKKRELVAEDYVYSLKRLLDPRVASPLLGELEGKIVGVDEALAKARKANKFDYDTPIEGLKAIDRYTWRIKLTEPFYTFIYNFADCRVVCAMAREVVEKYGDNIGEHPVGTGPYRMAFWKRSSRMVFEKNPNYREEHWHAEPPAGDARGEEIARELEGKRIPLIDRVEINVIEETQPRWLAFLNGEFDLLYGLPEEYANQAIPGNKLAPNLRKMGLRMEQAVNMDLTYSYFNMDDPVVGGYTPEKVALRRAISLAYKTRDEIAVLRKNLAIPAETPYSPGVAGYDPNFRTNANEYSPAKAKALLDMFGYVDRDNDGYREMPDGSPLVIHMNSTPTAVDQQYDELWKRSMDAIGVRVTFRKAKWPDLLKESNLGKLQFWRLGGTAAAPDADTWLQTLYSPNAGEKGNRSRFRNAEYDRIYEKARVLPDGPERTALYEQLAKICVAYAPYKIHVHRIATDIWYPWVVGYRRNPMVGNHFWKYLDVAPH
jgi:peptide/nickel transport system substrate-binding protein